MSGRVKLYSVDDLRKIWQELTDWQENACTREAGVITAKALLLQDPAYVLNTMYIEFENLANGGDSITVSGIDKSIGLSYYTDLSGSGTKDYLRVALNGLPHMTVASGYDSDLRAGHYNQGRVYGQTAGTEGVHGKSFSSGANSKVYGIALVSAPVWGDPTKDIVYSRAYYSAGSQVLKAASKEIGVAYDITFNHDE